MSARNEHCRQIVRELTVQSVRFQRRADGAVVVWFTEQPRDRPGLYRRVGIIPANEWASVISSLTTEGETGFSFGLALQFHTGGAAYDLDAYQHESDVP